MKLKSFFLVLIILFAFFQICFGQENFEAVKVDEFGEINCDDLSARIDNLNIALNNAPQAKGYIIIYGDNNEPAKKYFFAEMIKGFTKFLRVDINRFEFRFGEAENFKTQFWIVPNDKAFLIDQEIKHLELPAIFNPIVVHRNSDFSEICPDKFNYKIYSDLLIGNTNVNGHIVIYEKSQKDFLKTKMKLLNELIKKQKIPQNQIKFFYVRRSTSDVEFWFVPRRKK